MTDLLTTLQAEKIRRLERRLAESEQQREIVQDQLHTALTQIAELERATTTDHGGA